MKLWLYMVLLALGLQTSMPTFSQSPADYELEVIQLSNRPAQDILPLVAPFVISGGSISGSDFKLFVRSTPANIADIRRLVADIDSPRRQLLIQVSTDQEYVRAEQSAALTARAGDEHSSISVGQSLPDGGQSIIIQSGQGAQISSRVHSTRSQSSEPGLQTLRIQEGQWASISTGQAVPLAQRIVNPDGTITETIHYQQATSGFQVRAQLSGDQVNLDIRPQRMQPGRSGGGQFDISEVQTSIQAGLGQWVELGSVLEQVRSSSTGTVYSTHDATEQQLRIYVKVEVQ